MKQLSKQQIESIAWMSNVEDELGDIADKHIQTIVGKSPYDYEDGNELISDLLSYYMECFISHKSELDKKTLKGLCELIQNYLPY